MRWERWECRDANGRVLARISGLLRSGQHLDNPPVHPPRTRLVVATVVRLVPPLVQRREVPIPVPPGP